MTRQLAFVWVLLLGACASERAPRSDVRDSPATSKAASASPATASTSTALTPDSARALLFAAVDQFGSTRAEVIAALGPPASASVTPVQNMHEEGVTDTTVTLSYPGLRIGLFVRSRGERGFVFSLELSERRFDIPLGLGVGASCSQVEATLGAPMQREPSDTLSVLRYEDDSVIMMFECRAGYVTRVIWKPFVD